PFDPAQTRYLQNRESIPRQLYDEWQTASAGQSRAHARFDARRDDPQHQVAGRRAPAATPREDLASGAQRRGGGLLSGTDPAGARGASAPRDTTTYCLAA